MATLRRFAVAVVLAFGLALPVFAAPAPHVTISLDATEAPRKIFHAHLTIPASPGHSRFTIPNGFPANMDRPARSRIWLALNSLLTARCSNGGVTCSMAGPFT